MTQRTALRGFDNRIASVLGRPGLRDAATYTAPSGSPIACTVLVDRNTQLLSADGSSATVAEVMITAFLAELGNKPARGGRFAIGSETFEVDSVLDWDESRARCIVRAV